MNTLYKKYVLLGYLRCKINPSKHSTQFLPQVYVQSPLNFSCIPLRAGFPSLDSYGSPDTPGFSIYLQSILFFPHNVEQVLLAARSVLPLLSMEHVYKAKHPVLSSDDEPHFTLTCGLFSVVLCWISKSPACLVWSPIPGLPCFSI